MARYVCKESFDVGNDSFEEGQEVDVSQIPRGALGKFRLIVAKPRVDDRGSDDDSDKERIANPNREELKKLAADMGLTFPANISTAKLQTLVDEKAKEINGAEGDNE